MHTQFFNSLEYQLTLVTIWVVSLILPTALAASDQDLVNSMMVHDDKLMTYDVPFSKGTSSTPCANLGCEGDINYEIFIEVALQMADSKG